MGYLIHHSMDDAHPGPVQIARQETAETPAMVMEESHEAAEEDAEDAEDAEEQEEDEEFWGSKDSWWFLHSWETPWSGWFVTGNGE